MIRRLNESARSGRERLSSFMDDASRLPAATAASAYGVVAIVLHWLLAALIATAFLIGLSMVDLPFSPQRFRFFNWHKWLGIAVLVLSAARLLWRASGHPPPPIPAGMPPWQVTAFRVTHLAFYGLFFVVPLTGWAYTSAVGVPVVFSAGCRCPTSFRATRRSATRC
jgi:cytochrome b561